MYRYIYVIWNIYFFLKKINMLFILFSRKIIFFIILVFGIII